MKKRAAALLSALLLLPAAASAGVDVLAAGWWNASLEELSSARKQLDYQITALGGEIPGEVTPTPLPSPTPERIIQYVYITPEPTAVSPSTPTPEPVIQYVYITPEPTAEQTVRMPNLHGLSVEEAKEMLGQLGLLVRTVEKYSDDNVAEGRIMNQSYRAASDVKAGSIVTLTVSKGPIYVYSQHCTWRAWWVKGSEGDNYDFDGMPYICYDELVIPLKAVMNSKYKHLWRGYGTASVTDTFDKVVPIVVEYEQEEMKKGEEQRIVIRIPLQYLNVERPTTISTKLEMYYGNKKNEESVRIDFTFSWPKN